MTRSLQHGWVVYSSFIYGSPYGHAQTYRHPDWGYLDLHRMFPGIRLDPEKAFDELWHDRVQREFAGTVAAVPSSTAQAVLLVLNDVRSRQAKRAMKRWVKQPGLDRAEVMELVGRLDARVAFAAATGDLAQYRGERDYRLWKSITEGSTHTGEWWARVRAARTLREALGIVVRAPLANVERLTHQLGGAPRVPRCCAQLPCGLRGRCGNSRRACDGGYGRDARRAARGGHQLRRQGVPRTPARRSDPRAGGDGGADLVPRPPVPRSRLAAAVTEDVEGDPATIHAEVSAFVDSLIQRRLLVEDGEG